MGNRHPVQLAAGVAGAAFLLVGVLGFVPGITTGHLQFAGHHGGAKLLGVFEVSVLHNTVHLLFGLAALWLARQAATAKWYLVGGGAIYLVLTAYGLAVGHDSAANFVPVNMADNGLHLVLGLGLVAAGVVLGRSARPALTH